MWEQELRFYPDCNKSCFYSLEIKDVVEHAACGIPAAPWLKPPPPSPGTLWKDTLTYRDVACARTGGAVGACVRTHEAA